MDFNGVVFHLAFLGHMIFQCMFMVKGHARLDCSVGPGE